MKRLIQTVGINITDIDQIFSNCVYIDGINKDIQHIKYDYVSIESIKTLYLLWK